MDDLKTIYQMFTDAWRIYRKYRGTRNNEDDKWIKLVEEAGVFQQRYGHGQMAFGLIRAVLDQLEEEAKEREKHDQMG